MHILVVAGSDSSGGAGLARDIETIIAFGLRPAIACTAVTAQTHAAVRSVHPVPPDMVAQQMRAAFATGPIGAVKIGMLPTAETVEAVASVVNDHRDIPMILDPVLAATSGGRLIDEAGIEAVRTCLLAMTTVVTPNWPELATLASGPAASCEGEALTQAAALLGLGARNILVKGGHNPCGKGTDLLVPSGRTPVRFEGPALEGAVRGTGCILASAIASAIAQGKDLPDAIRLARERVRAKFQVSGEAVRKSRF